MSRINLILNWIPSVLLLLFCGLVFAFLCFYAYIKYLHMKYAHIPGPPLDNFLFGHALTMGRLTKDGFIHDKFLEWSETYGPVYKVHVLQHVMIFTTCPETTKKVLVSSKHYKDKVMYSGLISLFGQRFLGQGILTQVDHDHWYKQRRIMDPAFSSTNLKSFLTHINDQSEKMMDNIKEAVESDSVASMTDLISNFTMNVLAKVAFDIDSETMKDNAVFTKAIRKCMGGMIVHARDKFFQYEPGNKAYVEAVKEAGCFLRKTGKDWISRRRTAMKNNERCPNDILNGILKNAKQDATMTAEDEEVMVDNFVTFFVGGQETTSNQLAFCVRELARNPDILEKARKEVDEVIGMKQDISSNNLGELVYVTQVLKEILRIYPIAPLVPRRVNDDLVIDGLRIPGGVNVVFSQYVCGRLDKFFKDPLVFDPDRFHPDAPKPYYCYYPFALGARNCIGQNLSQMEAKVLVAKLIQRFDFTLTPGQKFGIVDTGTLRPQSDVTCFVKYRDMKK